MFNKGKKTHLGTLPQFQALESQAADTPRGSERNGFGEHSRKRHAPVIELARGEPARKVNPAASPAKLEQSAKAEKTVTLVFVLASGGTPLMPCHPARAREFLKKGRARVHKLYPFTIRLVDRNGGETQPILCKIDPGATTSGLALNRAKTDDPTRQTTLHLAELTHRGHSIRTRTKKRANYRRRRRSVNLRYRAPRFKNRARANGWLPPSLKTRVDNIHSWVTRYAKLAPLSALAIEAVRFDSQLLQNPELTGAEYQQGTLAGYELKEYLLEKWGRQCAYCDQTDLPLEIDHIVPKALHGSDRASNLTLACHDCNQRKGDLPLERFLAEQPDRHQRILARTKKPLAASAVLNATRTALVRSLRTTALTVETFSGGLTKFNRAALGIPKTHALDAACVGQVNQLANWHMPIFYIKATGRGAYQRTRVTKDGFPRAHLTNCKSVYGFRTGDLVKAVVPKGKKRGVYRGRVAVRANGSFNIQAPNQTIQAISHRYCQRTSPDDGYTYNLRTP